MPGIFGGLSLPNCAAAGSARSPIKLAPRKLRLFMAVLCPIFTYLKRLRYPQPAQTSSRVERCMKPEVFRPSAALRWLIAVTCGAMATISFACLFGLMESKQSPTPWGVRLSLPFFVGLPCLFFLYWLWRERIVADADGLRWRSNGERENRDLGAGRGLFPHAESARIGCLTSVCRQVCGRADAEVRP